MDNFVVQKKFLNVGYTLMIYLYVNLESNFIKFVLAIHALHVSDDKTEFGFV